MSVNKEPTFSNVNCKLFIKCSFSILWNQCKWKKQKITDGLQLGEQNSRNLLINGKGSCLGPGAYK